MDIRVLQLIEGAKQAEGLTVVIDVFRAFSVACYVMNGGAERIIPVGAIEEAYRLKREHPEFILMGERGGMIQPGFDYGNSPSHIEHVNFDGKTIVHTTSAGTQGLVHAQGASVVLTGSFVNAAAIVRFIRQAQPKVVSLVAMGFGGEQEADEDTLCARYIEAQLRGKTMDFDEIVRFLKTQSRTNNFLDIRDQGSAPKEDFELCLALNRFPFVLQAVPWKDGLLRLRKIAVDVD